MIGGCKMKKVIGFLITITILSVFLGSIEFAKEFPDVESSHWAYKYIDTLSSENVINGYDDGTFQPSGTITKGEFLKLVIAACLPPYVTIDEIEGGIDHWAGPYLKIAENYNLVEIGAINLENINEPITRLEMVRLISNADIIMFRHKSQFSQTVDFLDVGTLSLVDTYKLSHAVATGLVKGYEDKTFKPEQTMTRAEAATMIYRFYESKGAN